MNWKFWKKDTDELAAFERELGLNTDSRLGIQTEHMPEEPHASSLPDTSFDARSAYDTQKSAQVQQQQQQVQQSAVSQNDMQVLSAKLDTIKALLELLNQRINTLERNVEEKQKQKLW